MAFLSEELSFKAGTLALKYPQIPLADIIIATIASAHQARIITNDHHYNMLGVKNYGISKREDSFNP